MGMLLKSTGLSGRTPIRLTGASGIVLAILLHLAVFVPGSRAASDFCSGFSLGGMADASAGEWLGNHLFVVANDEDNLLRVYRFPSGGAPAAVWDASPYLALAPQSPETDIEGSAKMGDTIYWITSHAPNKKGKPRPNRKRFFATRVTLVNGAPVFSFVGRPVATLIDELARDARYTSFRLAEAMLRPPKTPGSLNIEALCDRPDGALLIGFRSPLPEGKALLAPLLNPAETVTGQPPRFGSPLLIDLGGNGIRAMLRKKANGYLIMSGSPLKGGTFRPYRWNGRDAPRLETWPGLPHDATPEALIEAETETPPPRLLILSDDGTRLIDGHPAKTCPDPARRTCRGFIVPLR